MQILFSHRALREYIGEEAFRYAKRCGLCRLPFDIFETMEDICLPRRFREAEFPTLSKHVLTSGVSPHGCGEELLTFTDDLSLCVCIDMAPFWMHPVWKCVLCVKYYQL